MLNEATLGIIGLGEIGRELAIRAKAFGMRVLYHQRTRMPTAEERELSATYVSLYELLERSDWVVPQLPGGPGTQNLLGHDELSRMRAGACIVNISNADIVNRAALIEALRGGRLGGFALDPLYEEPGRSDDELLDYENVVLVPHMAGSPRSNALGDFEDLITGDRAGVDFMTLRSFKTLVIFLLGLVAWPALGQDITSRWPDRPIRLVVPFPAGSATDSVARIVGQKLSS